MRQTLIAAARQLFVERGYAATSTPEISKAAGVSRGALYHHFADKKDLFRAVVMTESCAIAEEIEDASPPGALPDDALVAGSDAYLDAMTKSGRTRLLLVEAPVILGPEELAAIDKEHAGSTLLEGLAAMPSNQGASASSLEALGTLLSAAFDQAALQIASGADAGTYRAVLITLVRTVAAGPLAGGAMPQAETTKP